MLYSFLSQFDEYLKRVLEVDVELVLRGVDLTAKGGWVTEQSQYRSEVLLDGLYVAVASFVAKVHLKIFGGVKFIK